jgi:hypothetical protein
MELVGSPRGPRGKGKQPGHYEVKPWVNRGREISGQLALVWVQGNREHVELVMPVDRLPLVAEAVATYLVENELPFGAAAQGGLRRAGVPFPARPGDPPWSLAPPADDGEPDDGGCE